LPDHPAGFIQLAVSSASRGSVPIAMIQQQNHSNVSLLVRNGELVPERHAPSRTWSGSGETSMQQSGPGAVAEGMLWG
jgi:hypothetical protein